MKPLNLIRSTMIASAALLATCAAVNADALDDIRAAKKIRIAGSRCCALWHDR